MKSTLSLVAVLAAPAFSQIQTPKFNETYFYPSGFQTPQTAPEIPFDLPNLEYFTLPGDMQFGEVSAVTSNSKGHVFILSRSNAKGDIHGGSATQVFEFDEKGKYVNDLSPDLHSFRYRHCIPVDQDAHPS